MIAGAIDFPQGILSLEDKVKEFQRYYNVGFREIDYVLNQKNIEEKKFDAIQREMQVIHELCVQYGIKEKVIVEMCKLTYEDKVRICEIANIVLPAFLKTSTGKSFQGAQVEDVKLMKSLLKKSIRIKAAGGIKTYAQAQTFLNAGASVLGASAGIGIVEEERKNNK